MSAGRERDDAGRVEEARRHDISPPAYETLPERRSAGGLIRVALEVVTPILGGAARTRALDEVDVIRPASVRGHLRFWWRALHGHEYESSSDLYRAESELWGRAADGEGGRSPVDVRIEVEKAGASDASDIDLAMTPGAYVLWPARSETARGTPPAPRRLPGTRFELMLAGPKDVLDAVAPVVRAWVLFGGYGARTRRGLGSLRVMRDASDWLPRAATADALHAAFRRNILAASGKLPTDTPWLAGASLHVGTRVGDAQSAWTRAHDWLKEFRQGTNGPSGGRAREPGAGKAQPNRPSISNWPEADKIRHLKGKMAAHPPRHNAEPAWPRAGFGLPIIGRFHLQGRAGGRLEEPGPYELRWRSAGGREHDRLGSALIVKALPLADGGFVPCALWLQRAVPPGQVVLKDVPGSGAPFDRLVAPGDTPLFSALAGKVTLRDAFLDWLQATHGTTVIG